MGNEGIHILYHGECKGTTLPHPLLATSKLDLGFRAFGSGFTCHPGWGIQRLRHRASGIRFGASGLKFWPGIWGLWFGHGCHELRDSGLGCKWGFKRRHR